MGNDRIQCGRFDVVNQTQRRLNAKESEVIQAGLALAKSAAELGRQINRDASELSREIQRNGIEGSSHRFRPATKALAQPGG